MATVPLPDPTVTWFQATVKQPTPKGGLSAGQVVLIKKADPTTTQILVADAVTGTLLGAAPRKALLGYIAVKRNTRTGRPLIATAKQRGALAAAGTKS